MDSRLRLDIEDNACGNVGTVAEDMYENGNKIGTNGLTQKKKDTAACQSVPQTAVFTCITFYTIFNQWKKASSNNN
jgi:hypothetical protein